MNDEIKRWKKERMKKKKEKSTDGKKTDVISNKTEN